MRECGGAPPADHGGAAPDAQLRCLRAALSDADARRAALATAVATAAAAAGAPFPAAGLGLEQSLRALEAAWGRLGLPAGLLGGIGDCLDNFDLGGGGALGEAELGLALERWLEHQVAEVGGRLTLAPEVPRRSPSEAGYALGRAFGGGVQGTVRLCTKQGRELCLKGYPRNLGNPFPPRDFLGEVRAMQCSDSRHVAKVFEVFQDHSFHYMVMEMYAGGDLTTLGKRAASSGVSLSERWWRGLFKQCLEGLAHLHSRGFIHCDVKEPNIVVASSGSYAAPRPVLVDMGLCMPFDDTVGEGGTVGYMPPEVFADRRWYPNGDSFSLGIVIFQMAIGQVPDDERKVPGVLYGTTGCPLGELNPGAWAAAHQPLPWDRFPRGWPELSALVGLMTERDRARRPRPAQALRHGWFASDSDAALPAASLQGLAGAGACSPAGEATPAKWKLGAVLPEPRMVPVRGLPMCPDGRPPARPTWPRRLPPPVSVRPGDARH